MKPITVPEQKNLTKVSTNRVVFSINQTEGATDRVKEHIVAALKRPFSEAVGGLIERSELLRLLGELPKDIKNTVSYTAIYQTLMNREQVPNVA